MIKTKTIPFNKISSGLELFVRMGLNIGQSSARNVLVIVHQGEVNSGTIRENIMREIKIIGEENVYHSNFNPYDSPIEQDSKEKISMMKKERFPTPEETGTILVAGGYKEICVQKQIEWLRDNGYKSIKILYFAIQ